MAKYLSSLPNRALIKFGKHQVGSETAEPIIWMIADTNHGGYPADSVTLISQKIIDLRAFDAGEDVAGYNYGNNNYKLSNINSWLNSSASAGKWYTATHTNDAPPNGTVTPYQSRPGFLYNFTAEERLALLPTTITVQVASNVSTSVVSKVFIPSMWEIIGTHTVADGSKQLQCFVGQSVTCGLTNQAFNNTLAGDKPATSASNWRYMTRSTIGYNIVSVSATGTSVEDNAYSGNVGVRPVINLSANTKVSENPDANGYYTVLYNTPPIISGADSNLGIKDVGFPQTYSVDDLDKEAVTVTEYIDNVKVRSYVATLGATNTFAVTGSTWLKLANGNHTLKITATDGFDEVTRTYTFIKSVTKLVVQRSTPLDSTTQPKSIIVTVVKNIPEGAIFKVEACNNGYDAVPTWEDITTRVLQGRIYDFTNTAKTAGKWGVNIRVTVDRNGAAGACYITEIGGNFE